MILESDAFSHGGEIPTDYTCEGRDTSPPLSWSEVGTGTKSLALIVDDPDAPDPAAPKTTWVHWVVCNIPATASSLVAGATGDSLPTGSQEGVNDWKRTGYGGLVLRLDGIGTSTSCMHLTWNFPIWAIRPKRSY